MAKRSKLRAAEPLALMQRDVVHDRRATDLPLNAQVHVVEIDDPYEAGKKISAVRSLRDDVLAVMHARGQIDEPQYRAGLEMQKFYEQAEIGGVRGIDLTKEYVDGGQFSEPLTEQIQKAIGEIARLERILGREGASLMRDVLCLGYNITKSASARGLSSQRGIAWVGGLFRMCLETLARELGYVG